MEDGNQEDFESKNQNLICFYFYNYELSRVLRKIGLKIKRDLFSIRDHDCYYHNRIFKN